MSSNDNDTSIPDDAQASQHMNPSQRHCRVLAGTPLPKIGELGYVPGERNASAQSSSLRDQNATATNTGIILEPTEAISRLPYPATSSNISLPSNLPSQSSFSSSNYSNPNKILSYLLKRSGRPVDESHVCGVHILTILRLLVVIIGVIGTVMGWVLTILFVDDFHKSREMNNPPENTTTTTTSNGSVTQPLIFIHITFATIVLFLLIMLERLVFLARAQRHSFLHPVEGAARVGSCATTRVPLVPWTRLPLPTYAAALGYRGTGDVEDSVIAGPAPPEYGNTRGSTLLLVGPSLMELSRSRSVRSDRTMVSLRSVRSERSRHSERIVPFSEEVEGRGDQSWVNERRMSNADLMRRAQRLEQTLSALVQGTDGTVPGNGPNSGSDSDSRSRRTRASNGSMDSSTPPREAGSITVGVSPPESD